MSANAMRALMRDFGASIGIAELEPDEEHRCNMMFDDVAVSFELTRNETTLGIYALIGTIAHERETALHKQMLEANYLLHASAGTTLGIEAGSGVAVITREERLDNLRLPELEHIVESFVNTAEQWMKHIEGSANDTGQGTTAQRGEPSEEPARTHSAMRV